VNGVFLYFMRGVAGPELSHDEWLVIHEAIGDTVPTGRTGGGSGTANGH
jgi:hypothetical protein